MAPLEIVLLLVCWGLVYVRPSLARKLHDWAVRSLPDKSWYGLPNTMMRDTQPPANKSHE